ncbi:MAG: hypothetical protein E7Z79_06850 [Methanobrevibacter thaueri]|uniref:Uncharacterized protein n=1 Tax=Methanobrevibacter thaueri TaxID=190975 RepID=A0A8T3V900_9EURY|nr:hypothetical protein [Methanobrevibacter thaueri]MBE6502146.1 hypothetical protein [Methanobrevibacter thaueri]
MKLKLMFVSLIFLIFFVGAVSAVGITDYNAPIGFERDPVTFTKGDFEMEMNTYSSFVDHDDYFNTTDDRQVKIINDTYAEYFDSVKERSGALEIVKIDDDQYVVDSFFDGDDKGKTNECLKYLQEFNDLNKFKPIKIDKAS